ncbi:hypothetical protein SANTM175S_06733 [Streptomyces antimycoticus]
MPRDRYQLGTILTLLTAEPALPSTSPYRAIFAAPGAKEFSAAGFLGRMTLSMAGIGVVTMVSELTGRYGLAGALSATLALSAASLGPQISRLVDRHGQRRVLRPATLVALTAVCGLLLSAHRGWPDWTLFVFAAGAGCVPSVGSMARARWAAIYGALPARRTPRTPGSPSSTRSASSSGRSSRSGCPPPGSRRRARCWPPASWRPGSLADRAAGRRARTASAWAAHRPSALRSRGL